MTIDYLNPKDMRMRMSFNEVIGPPFDGFKRMLKLPGCSYFFMVFNNTPWQHSNRKRHRKTKFNVVPSIIVSSHQIYLKVQHKCLTLNNPYTHKYIYKEFWTSYKPLVLNRQWGQNGHARWHVGWMASDLTVAIQSREWSWIEHLYSLKI